MQRGAGPGFELVGTDDQVDLADQPDTAVAGRLIGAGAATAGSW